MSGLRLECYMNEAGGNGDQVLNSMESGCNIYA